MIMMSTLYYTNMLSWVFIVLASRNNSPWVDLSLPSDTLSWFRADQSWLLLRDAACLAEKQRPVTTLWHTILIPSRPVLAPTPWCCMLSREAANNNVIVWSNWNSKPMIYHTQGDLLTITKPMIYHTQGDLLTITKPMIYHTQGDLLTITKPMWSAYLENGMSSTIVS
jgi:hypothetical protein